MPPPGNQMVPSGNAPMGPGMQNMRGKWTPLGSDGVGKGGSGQGGPRGLSPVQRTDADADPDETKTTHSRTEFVIFLFWKEPIPSDALFSKDSTPPGMPGGNQPKGQPGRGPGQPGNRPGPGGGKPPAKPPQEEGPGGLFKQQ